MGEVRDPLSQSLTSTKSRITYTGCSCPNQSQIAASHGCNCLSYTSNFLGTPLSRSVAGDLLLRNQRTRNRPRNAPNTRNKQQNHTPHNLGQRHNGPSLRLSPRRTVLRGSRPASQALTGRLSRMHRFRYANPNGQPGKRGRSELKAAEAARLSFVQRQRQPLHGLRRAWTATPM